MVFGTRRVEAVGAVDLLTFFDYAIGSAKVLVDDFADYCPAVGIGWTFTLVLKVLKYAFAILLDRLDVSEEGVSLRLEDGRSELASRRRSRFRRVESIQHGKAIGLAEGFQAHFIDKSL